MENEVFFFSSKRLHEGFHFSLSALPLSFNFFLCMPCPAPPTWTICVGPIPDLLLSYLLRSSQFSVYTARIGLIFLGQVSTVGPITGWLLVKNHKPPSEHQRQGCHIGCSWWSEGGYLVNLGCSWLVGWSRGCPLMHSNLNSACKMQYW